MLPSEPLTSLAQSLSFVAIESSCSVWRQAWSRAGCAVDCAQAREAEAEERCAAAKGPEGSEGACTTKARLEAER